MNKIRKIELIIFILFVCNASVIEGSGTGYKSGEAFLQTVDEIESWVIRSSIVETGQAWFDELAQEYSISSMRSVDISCTVEANFYHIIFDGTLNVMDLCNDFNVQEEVVIESWPVMIIEYYQDPNDPGFETQWGLGKIDATSAWEYESGNSSVIIGILDSGADVYDIENQQSTVHPDLLQNLWNENGLFGINVGQPGSRPIDYFGHGTHVAGIAGCVTNNSIGISGIAGGGYGNDEGIKLLIVKQGGDGTMTQEEIMAESICQALNPDGDVNTDDWVDIINMSWGMNLINGTTPPINWAIHPYPVLWQAISEAVEKGVVLIAAVGNNDYDYTQKNYVYWPYPAGYSEVIGVAASNFVDEKYVQSNMGTFIEIAAPGGSGQPYDNNDIISTYPRYSFTIQQQYPYLSNYYGYLSGTSMAAPYVAGLAGLILSRFPSYTASDVRNLIRNSAEEIGPYSYSNGWNKYFGYGRINAGYAIAPPSTPSNFYGTGHINQSPTLHWNSVVESDIDHLELKRTVTGQGGGNTVFTLSPGTTQYTDYTVIINRFGPSTIKYKLRSVDYTSQNSGYTNTVTYSGEGLWKQIADFEIIPDDYALHTAYPNPFNPTTSIRFDLPERSRVTMVIYDLLGKTIKTLVQDAIEPGFHEIRWNGKDDKGNLVSTGMYIYQFSAFSEESEKQFNKSNKLVLMK